MKLKVEFDELLPDDLMVVRSKGKNELIPKIEYLVQDPYLSNIIVAHQDSSYFPVPIQDIYYFYSENKAVFLKTKSDNFKTEERLY